MVTIQDFPVKQLPPGIIISAKKGKVVITWKQSDVIPEFEPEDELGHEENREKRYGSFLIIIAVLIVVFTILVIIILIIKNKIFLTEYQIGSENTPEEYEEDESFF